jgi:hypothetical protein
MEYLLDAGTKPTKVVLWGLPTNGTVTVEISGEYYNSAAPGQSVTFDYSQGYSTGAAGSTTEFWLDCMVGTVGTGKPPTPPVDPNQWFWTFLGWVMQNFILVIILVVGLYLMPILFPVLQPIFGFFGNAVKRLFKRKK